MPGRLKLVSASADHHPDIVPAAHQLLIGRDPQSHVVLAEPSVSRRHAQLTMRDDEVVLEDLGSAVGTFVNDQRINIQVLQDGDHVRFGRRVAFDVVSDATATLLDGPVEDVRHLQELLDVARQLNSAAVLPEVLSAVLRSAIRIMRAESGVLALIHADSRLDVVLRLPVKATPDVAQDEVSLLTDAVSQRRTVASQSMLETMTGVLTGLRPDMVATPLMVARRAMGDEYASFVGRFDALGALLVSRPARTQAVPPEELAIFESLAADAAMAIDSARLYRDARAKAKIEHEMALAKDIQASLLQAPPDMPFCTTWARTESAASVGGDLYQGAARPDGGLALALGDVAGKLIMALATGMLKLLHEMGHPLKDILPLLHGQLLNYSPGNKYLTLAAMVVYPDGRVLLANAGHCPPAIVRHFGHVSLIDAGGPVLGLLPFGDWTPIELTLEPGDAIVIYSDGISESVSPSGEDFGPRGVAQTLERLAGHSAEDMAQGLLAASTEFREGRPADDDVSLLVMRYNG
jgi:serine phosphatase RsbU (regulator of sigma subunit)